jgi:hypothetical protein
VDLAEAVAVVITSELARRMADRLMGVAPFVQAIRVVLE